jgi:CRISPR-associated endonuclease/helicase Cas3
MAQGSDTHQNGRLMIPPLDGTFPHTVVPAGSFWAKTGPLGWHPLAAHLMDVAAVIRVLFEPGTALSLRVDQLARNGGVAPLPFQALATYLALTHDIGKVHHGFQERRLGSADMRRTSHVQRVIGDLRHAKLLDASGGRVSELRAALLAPLHNTNREVAFAHASLGIAHHGRPWAAPRQPAPAGWSVDWQPSADRDPVTFALRLVDQALHLSGLEVLSRGLIPAESQLLAGALTLADWIGSTEAIFPFAPDMEKDTGGYWEDSCERARVALQQTGTRRVLTERQATEVVWADLFPRLAARPSSLQAHVMSFPLPKPGDLVIIESDTGSGKTEAALALYARLRSAGRADGLFFALPTRATASAMHGRIREFAEGFCPEAAGNIVLASGGVADHRNNGDIEPRNDDDVECAAITRWASRSLTKAFAGELVVGTIDQALLATLPVKHAHLRLAALARLVIVVDELHSYDGYMLSLLSRLAQFIRSSGGVMVAMSATLATDVTHELAAISPAPSLAEARKRAFPSVSYGSSDGVLREHAIASPVSRERSYEIVEIPAESVARMANDAARDGARVLIIRNTVSAVFDTMQNLVDCASPYVWGPTASGAAPYHSRYTRADRSVLDTAIRRDFGRDSAVAGQILVATQVAEQSLDVDFDLLITDLCPIDVLLQRLGRVHRHERPRIQGYLVPRALVITPDRAFSDVLEGSPPSSWRRTGLGSVYEDLPVLALTQELIRRTPHLVVPTMNRAIIEEVYHRESRDRLLQEDKRWERIIDRQLGATMGQRAVANKWRLPLMTAAYSGEEMTELFRLSLDEELRLRSRLGDDKIRLEFDVPVPSHFAIEPGDAFVDVEWRRLEISGAANLPQIVLESSVHDFSFTAGKLRGVYSRFGWVFSAIS